MGASSQTNLCEGSTTTFIRMIFLGLVLVSPTFLYGLNLSYSTVALPQMNLNISDASWLASIAIYTSPLSTIIVGLIIDKFGRKTALMYSIVPSIIGWSLLYWSSSVFFILLGQMFNGLTMGAGFYPVQVYAGECIMVDNVRLRNIFMTWISVSSSLGTTCMLLMANFFNYHDICAISATLCLGMLLIFHFVIPESPSWLHRSGRTGDAEWSQRKLGIAQPILSGRRRRRRPSSTSECEKAGEQPPYARRGSVFARQMEILGRPDVYKPILILSVASTILSFCGTITVVSYMINIIDNTIPGVESSDAPAAAAAAAAASASSSNATITRFFVPSKSYRYSFVSGLFMCLGSLMSIAVLPRMGLKKMFIGSKMCIILALVALTYGTIVEPAFNEFLRTAAVTFLSFLMGLEVGPRMSFAGDVFPVDAKGFASVPALTGSVATATANKIFPYLRVVFGGYAYLFYAAASVSGIFYIHFFLPEVVGRTLDEINSDFKKEEEDN